MKGLISILGHLCYTRRNRINYKDLSHTTSFIRRDPLANILMNLLTIILFVLLILFFKYSSLIVRFKEARVNNEIRA